MFAGYLFADFRCSWILNFKPAYSNQLRMFKILLLLLAAVPMTFYFSSCFVPAQFEDDQFDLNEHWFTDDLYNSTYFSNIRERKYGIIAPGTKWCGQGSKAENYTDLGRFNKTDACCRAHDNCPIVIKAGASIHNLFNLDKSSRLSCECDEEFYTCLKEIRDIVSKTIGTIYFDILQKKCLIQNNGNYAWCNNKSYSDSKFIAFIRKIFL